STSSTCPPSDSTCTSCCSNSVRTRSGLASGRSILLIATIIGTFAALAWLMASTVCGMTPSSAATTSTTMSVTLAPRARIGGEGGWGGGGVEGYGGAGGRSRGGGAVVWGGPAGPRRRYFGRTNGVEQRGLAVVDVTHDGHHRRTRDERGWIVGDVEEALLDVG